MKKNVLALCIASCFGAVTLSGCSNDEGFDPGFVGEQPLEFTDLPPVEVTEDSGIVTIDLLAGITSGGEAATGLIVVSDFNFTPTPGGFATPEIDDVSPFSIDDGILTVDTNQFSDSLIGCETPPPSLAGTPNSVTYNIDFALDNGFDLPPSQNLPRRSVQLTINGVVDEVESVSADPISLPLGTEDEVSFSVTILPESACDQSVTFTVADETIATVDPQGLITGLQEGTTSVTIASGGSPDISTSVALEILPPPVGPEPFSLSVSNQEFDAAGTPEGMITVPSCVHTGLYVDPIPSPGAALNGDYTFTWTSSNDVDFPVTDSISFGQEGLGMFSVGSPTNDTFAGSSFDATVALESGDTGPTPLADVLPQQVTVNVAQNLMCAPGEPPTPNPFTSDLLLDGPGAAGGSGPAYLPNNVVSTVDEANGALSGNALQITMTNSIGFNNPDLNIGTLGPDNQNFTRAFQNIGNENVNWFSFTFGRGPDESVGRTFVFSVWVRLSEIPANPVFIRHALMARQFGDTNSNGFNPRYPGAAIFTEELRPTTEWQLVEFTLESGNLQNNTQDSREWTVPALWSVTNNDVLAFFEFEGFPNGATLLMDEYSVIEVE